VARQQQYSPTKGEVLGTTEARQANSRKMSMRVLVISTALITIIFAGFILAFLYQTPARMDGTDKTGVVSHPVTTVPQEGTPLPKVEGATNPGSDVRKQEAPSPQQTPSPSP
jgi:hypothetical protein